LACDDFFVSQTSQRGALFRCDSFPQATTLRFVTEGDRALPARTTITLAPFARL
jgi:hypothetical protein